jgi:hypothetical protein
LAEGLDVFRLRAVPTGRRGFSSGNLSFAKIILWLKGSAIGRGNYFG